MSNIDSAAQEIEDLLTREPASVKLSHTCDNVLDETFKSFFEVMRPDRLTFLYEKWRQCHWRAGSRCPELPWLQDPDATAAHSELSGLQWGAIYDAAKRVENLAGVGENLRLASSASITELDAAWQGKAADAAQEKFSEIKTASGDFKDVTTKLSTNLMGLWRATTEAVNHLCKLADNPLISGFVAEYGVDGAMPDGHGMDWYAYIDPDIAVASSDGTRGDWSRIMDHYLTFSSQAEIAAEDPDDWPAWTQIFDDFCFAYNDAVGLFRKGLYAAHRTVEQALQSFHQEVGWLAAEYDPFAKIAPPESKNNDGGGIPIPGGTPGYSVLPVTTGADVSGQTSEAPAVTTGANPVTGKPLEFDPETGKAYPIDPESGEPGSDVDTTTVRKGDSELSITEPSSAGKMSISVDDATGNPKEYKLDFGNEKDGKDSDVGAGAGAGGFWPQGGKDSGRAGPGGSDDVHTPGEGERLEEDKSRLLEARERLMARGEASDGDGDPKFGRSGVGSGVGIGAGAGTASSAGVGSTAPLEAGARSGVGVAQGTTCPGFGAEPDVQESPFGVARISGSIDDDGNQSRRVVGEVGPG